MQTRGQKMRPCLQACSKWTSSSVIQSQARIARGWIHVCARVACAVRPCVWMCARACRLAASCRIVRYLLQVRQPLAMHGPQLHLQSTRQSHPTLMKVPPMRAKCVLSELTCTKFVGTVYITGGMPAPQQLILTHTQRAAGLQLTRPKIATPSVQHEQEARLPGLFL